VPSLKELLWIDKKICINYFNSPLGRLGGFVFITKHTKPHFKSKQSAIRSLVAETVLTPNDFIVPLFIDEGENVKTEIASMPNYYRMSIDNTIAEVKELYSLGIKSVLLFVKAKDETKDNTGKEAWNKDGLMQRSIKALKMLCRKCM
jgi:delta-aminolevulinic acid dehydratase/porphobilinogen synthase